MVVGVAVETLEHEVVVVIFWRGDDCSYDAVLGVTFIALVDFVNDFTPSGQMCQVRELRRRAVATKNGRFVVFGKEAK